MSDIGVSYDLHYTPDPINATLSLLIADQDIKVKAHDVPKIVVGVTPHYSGNIVSDVLSTIGTPMANAISLGLGAFADKLFDGIDIKIHSIPNIDLNVEDAKVILKPDNLKLSNYNDMLMVSSSVDVNEPLTNEQRQEVARRRLQEAMEREFGGIQGF